jgi:glycosyltransferase involved in cell wall biosynthesis
MNVWLIQTGEQLPIKSGIRKMRTSLLADKLLERGHAVYWWASAFEHQRKVMIADRDENFDVSEKYVIRILRGCKYRRNISLYRYIDHYIVASKFRFQSKKYHEPDVIVASVPDHLIAYEASRYARKNGIPFVVDIRDLWPEVFIQHIKDKVLYRLAWTALLMDFVRLSFLLKRADALVAISRGYLKWGLVRTGRAATVFDNVFYLGYKKNYSKDPARIGKKLDIPVWLKGREEQKIFLFIGTFGVSYELELVVQAAKRFHNKRIDDICFVLAGLGDKFNMLSEKVAGLQNIVLPGWVKNSEIDMLLKRSYVGLLSYIKDAPQGLPNKFFEYLSVGLPIINSIEGEMADLIDRHRFGLNYFPGNLKELCQCIERLSNDSSLHAEMSKNGLKFFKNYGEANKIYDEYVQHIEKLVKYRKA